MSLLKTIIFTLLISFSLFAQECRNILEIKTNQPEALIFIDEEFIGKGNIKIEVEQAKYYIFIRESLVKWNGYEVYDSVNVKLCDKEYLIEYNLFEKYFVDSNPQNAKVTIFGNLIGYTPAYIKSESYDVIEIEKGNEKKIISTNDLKTSNIIEFEHVTKGNNSSFTESDWFKVLLGSAAALGAVTAYYKNKADKKYYEYLVTKNNNTLKSVDRYDLYSGIAFGLLQVNFGYLIYKFLIE